MSSPPEKCKNIKSRHYKNIQCTHKASHGDYCSKHWKKPKPFIALEANVDCANIIQRCCKRYLKRNYFKRQGPSRGCLEISNNTTELYSLEELSSIPSIYIYSFADSKKCIWTFDIRTLSFMLSTHKQPLNPYTRDPISKENIACIEARIKWLKAHSYYTMYNETSSFTSTQLWNQRVLEVFTKIEELGYIVNSDWFHNLDKNDHIDFYKHMCNLWNIRLNLTHAEKNSIIPGYQSVNKVFRLSLSELPSKDIKLLRKHNLQLIERFISSADEKTHQSLGIMYILMGLSYVCCEIGEAYPWILESVL